MDDPTLQQQSQSWTRQLDEIYAEIPETMTRLTDAEIDELAKLESFRNRRPTLPHEI